MQKLVRSPLPKILRVAGAHSVNGRQPLKYQEPNPERIERRAGGLRGRRPGVATDSHHGASAPLPRKKAGNAPVWPPTTQERTVHARASKPSITECCAPDPQSSRQLWPALWSGSSWVDAPSLLAACTPKRCVCGTSHPWGSWQCRIAVFTNSRSAACGSAACGCAGDHLRCRVRVCVPRVCM